MNPWTKILPFFFIEWFSKRYCERNCCERGTFVLPFKHVRIYFKPDEENSK